MLTTETYQLDDALDDLDDQITALDDELDDLDPSTDEHAAVEARRDQLHFRKTGLKWQRDEEDWGDAEITLGALTAGEDAMRNRIIPDDAGHEERVLWLIAASTIDAPYAERRSPDDRLTESVIEANFQGLAGPGIHPGFAKWLEAKVNGLGVPDAVGNRSSTSSQATSNSGTSTTERDSTTSSSSDSPTA